MLCRLPTKAELAAGLKALKDGEADYAEMVAEAQEAPGDALAAYEKTLPAQQAQWEASLIQRMPTWQPLEVANAVSKGGATLTKQPDGSILASGKNPAAGHLHDHGEDDRDGHHGHSPGSAAGQEPAGHGAGPVAERQLRPQRAEAGRARARRARQAGAGRAAAAAGDVLAGRASTSPGRSTTTRPPAGRSRRSSARPTTALFELGKPIAFPKGAVLTFTMQHRFRARTT